MKFNLSAWIGQVTTGHGAMILGPTLLAVASGTMSWQTAIPLLVAGAIGLLWPENTALKTAAQNAATDVEALIAAYRSGLDHGAAIVAEPKPPAPEAASGNATAALSLMAGLLLAGIVSACTAQQQTDVAIGCNLDQSFQPIAADLLATLVPASSDAVSIDDLLVHPAVVAYCQSLGGTPAPAPAATPAATTNN